MSYKAQWVLITLQEIDSRLLKLSILEKNSSGEDREYCVEIENILHTLEPRGMKGGKLPVPISPETRRFLYARHGMTPIQYNYLVLTGSYQNVGDHSEFEQQQERQTRKNTV